MFGKQEIDVGFPNDVTLRVGGPVYVVCFDWSVQFLYGEFG